MAQTDKLAGRKVLIVEDDSLIGELAAELLREHGMEVIGPTASVRNSVDAIASAPRIDAAIVDVNLNREEAFGVADALQARGVPFAFLTGYAEGRMPARFARVPCYRKPADPVSIVSNLLA